MIRAWDEGEHVHPAVIDHGPGIPLALREHLLSPFQRHGDHTTSGGLGLGLAIAYGFAHAMDATITASDTPGGGLTMTIRLRHMP